MPIILGKSRSLKPTNVKEIRYISHIEKKAINVAKDIARQFGIQSKKMKQNKIIIR